MNEVGDQISMWPYVTEGGETVYMTDEDALREGAQDVTMSSDGTIQTSVRSGGVRVPVSVLPQERMAASVPEPRLDEAREVMTLDPSRLEQWSPVKTSVLNGWRFQLTPLAGGQTFKFLAFRNPADGNMFRIWVISPDMDSPDFVGHKNHMVGVTVGGERIAVLCGPGGKAAKDLATARAYAAKWALYTARRMRGEPTLFSE